MEGFAFLDILAGERRGLLSRKFFLDTVAPVLYHPRVKRTIRLQSLGAEGPQVLVPLSRVDWGALNRENQARLWREAGQVAKKHGISVMAVNRALRFTTPEMLSIRVAWGDYFILALALVLAERAVNHYGADKLYLVGEFPGLPGLISLLGGMGVPVVLQTFYPARCEHLAYHMFYSQGVALSVGYFNPRNWGGGDAVLIFDPTYHRFVLGQKGVFIISLTDDSCCHAPELEDSLRSQEVDGSLKNLAPILEAYLMRLGPAFEPAAPLVRERRGAEYGAETDRRTQGDIGQEVKRVSETGRGPVFTVRPAGLKAGERRPGMTGLVPDKIGLGRGASRNAALAAMPKTASPKPGTGSAAGPYQESANRIISIKRKGERLKLWGFFLDKDFRALYNTIQGIEATT